MSRDHSIVVALSGGIGGAKLSLGLSRILPADELVIIANTGDDFQHLGLTVSPDIDTVMYTLAGLSNPATGWGRKDETWNFMSALKALGGETWFQLGDSDLATHVERTRRLRDGESLSSITSDFCRRVGIGPLVLPMSDDPVQTVVRTSDETMDFQEWFVHRQCKPVVESVEFRGAEQARAPARILELLAGDAVRAVVICPSNPYVSIDAILAVPGIRDAIGACKAPVVAVSPIIGGDAVKGPTAKLMREWSIEPSALVAAKHYADLLDGYILDEVDTALANQLDIPVFPAKTLMQSLEDRETLAAHVLASADKLSRDMK